jgi:DNA-directed RNA polymerase subunit M/transcription elongation factor TFIIS
MLSGRQTFCPRCGDSMRGETSFFGGLSFTCRKCGHTASASEAAAGQAQANAHRKREWDSQAGERQRLADERAAACEQANQEARTCPTCESPTGLWLAYRFEYRSGHVITEPRDDGIMIAPRSPFNEMPIRTLGEYECSGCGSVWFADLPSSPEEPGGPGRFRR